MGDQYERPDGMVTARATARPFLGVAPGRAKVVEIALPGTDAPLPCWVAVAPVEGPRGVVLAGASASEVDAITAAASLRALVPVAGALVVVPVLRAGGVVSRPGRRVTPWRFPGDPAGSRRARQAFAVWSRVVVGAQGVILLGAPASPYRHGAVVASAPSASPRAWRLALRSGARALVDDRADAGGALLPACREAKIPALALQASGLGAAGDLAVCARQVLATLGLVPLAGRQAAPVVVARPHPVRAPLAGLLQVRAAAGDVVGAGATLALLTPPLGARPTAVRSAERALVLEAPAGGRAAAGDTLFVLAPTSRAGTRPRSEAVERAALRAGWAEWVALPDLGVRRIKAKLDTGARTSALSVAELRRVGGGGRAEVEFRVATGPRRLGALVRAAVREHVTVRDSSGRASRRPVIETRLRLGGRERRVRLTLTARGDMLFPMLVGRTALSPDVVVDPGARYRLG